MYMYMDIYTYGYIDLRGGASPLSLSMNVCVGGVYTNICIHTQVRDLLCAPADNEGKKFGIVAGEHGGMAVADLVRVPVTTSADIDKLMRYVRHILCIYTYIYIHIHTHTHIPGARARHDLRRHRQAHAGFLCACPVRVVGGSCLSVVCSICARDRSASRTYTRPWRGRRSTHAPSYTCTAGIHT